MYHSHADSAKESAHLQPWNVKEHRHELRDRRNRESTGFPAAKRPAVLCLVALTLLVLVARPAAGAEPPNLLRNADLQDDWITLLPENLTLHWSYSPAFANRRDFNPDGWRSKGSWRWVDVDAPVGRRRFVVEGPAAEVSQRVNWVAVADDR
jgi:hypothetical protein